METDYFKILALSKSGIPALLRSPAHFKHAFETDMKTTPQMRRGSLIHLLNYKPQDFGTLYATFEGKESRATNVFKAFEKDANEQGKEVILQKEVDEANRVVDFLRSNKVIQRLMQNGMHEHPFVTNHPDYGVPVKGMFDCISDEFITDLKTTTASPEMWIRRGMDAQSHLQAAWYLMLAKLMDGKERRFAYKVVDVTPPYDIYIVEPDEDLLKHARATCERALGIFEKCFKADNWPHNKTRILTWNLPKYLKD